MGHSLQMTSPDGPVFQFSAFRSTSTTSRCPVIAASTSAVRPSFLATLAFEPARSRASTTGWCPASAASMSAV
eukprot:312402-Prymnesium_polylepis.1